MTEELVTIATFQMGTEAHLAKSVEANGMNAFRGRTYRWCRVAPEQRSGGVKL